MSFVKWSASRINVANYCRMRYWLRYVERKEPLRLSAYVKGSFLHEVIENFWAKLGTPEEVASKKSGKKYYDAESFAKFADGKWVSIIIADQRAKEKICWRYDNEQWAIRESLKGLGKKLFVVLQEEGPPLYSELSFDFIAEGKRISGRIDEVRVKDEKIIVRDYKSGRPWVGEMKLKHDPQLTIYGVAIGAMCFSDGEFARQLGLERERKMFLGNPLYIPRSVSLEFFMIEGLVKEGGLESAIHSTSRTDEQFLEVISMIEGTEKAISKGNVYGEFGKKCDDCDMGVACDAHFAESEKSPKPPQISFSFVQPSSRSERKEGPIAKQPRLRLRRKRKKGNLFI